MKIPFEDQVSMALTLAQSVEDEHQSAEIAHKLAHCMALQELIADLPQHLHPECYVIPEGHNPDQVASFERGSPFRHFVANVFTAGMMDGKLFDTSGVLFPYAE